VDLVEAAIGRRDPNDGRETVLMANAPQRLVLRIEDEIANSRVLQQHVLLAGVDIDGHDVAEGVVVLGVEGST